MVSKTILSIINAAFPCDPTRENGNPERPQTLRVSEIINNFSLAYAQSAAEGIPNHFCCSSMVWMRVLAR